jgi:hypothetical protein
MNIEVLNILVTILALLLLFYLVIQKKQNSFENFQDALEEVKDNELFILNRPFVNVYDNNGNQLNVALLSRPFYADSHEEQFKRMGKKFNILGISSYQEFPNQPFNPKDGYNDTTNKYDYNRWTGMCKGWLHCFRNPDDYLPSNTKSILLSESDFCDTNVNKPDPTVEKKYDFLYICHRDDLSNCSTNEWVAFNKNLELAEKCVSILCTKKKYKVLFIGRSGCDLPTPCENLQIETTDKLDYYELQAKFDECRFLFLPNVHDASPRVITEAMNHNLPCLINSKLVGGWKYINEQTGEFFTDESDFEEKVDKIMNNCSNYQPRQYFLENHGIVKSGEIFRDFIFEVFGDKINIPKSEIKYASMEFKKIDFTEGESFDRECN